MLILTRKKGQAIKISGDIEIFVSAIEGDSVKIGIRAPSDVLIMRKELLEEVQASNREAVLNSIDEGSKLLKKIKK